MIAAWMLAATLFAALLAIGALAAVRALRTLGRQARAPWLAALAAAVAWPLVAPVAAALLRKPGATTPIVLPVVQSTIGAVTAALPALPPAWESYADPVLLALWAVASTVLLTRIALAMRALARVARAATRDVVAGVPVLVTPTLGPAVFGARSPRVLVPRWLLDLDAPLRALVLHHEQEHCRARDPQLTLAVAVAVALMPWNAGAWWIARRLRLAVELDCDARVLRRAEDTERYGRLLLFIAQRQSQTRLAPMLAESNSHLDRRITDMNAPRPANPRLRVTLLVLAAAGAVACSTKYGNDLATAPSMSRSAAAQAQGGTYYYYEPAGAKPASRVSGATAPRYPEELKQSRTEGDVLVQFVVDTFGVVAPATIKVVRATHQLFADAVITALGATRFVPAEYQGRKVKQLLQEPFVFAIAKRASAKIAPPPVDARPTTDPANRNPMRLQPVVVTVP